MPNIAAVLKEEIARVTRKQVRAEISPLRNAAARARTEVAALKRRVAALEKLVARLKRSNQTRGAVANEDDSGGKFRYSTRSLIAQRRRMGLSAAAFGQLLGVSGQSIYKWEAGKARPRARQLAAIVALRGVGKREAAARLSA